MTVPNAIGIAPRSPASDHANRWRASPGTSRSGLSTRVHLACERGRFTCKPQPGRQWAATGGKGREPGRAPLPGQVNCIEAQFTTLRYFPLDGIDHASHREQASIIRRYIIWQQSRLRRIVDQANVA